MNCTLTQEQLDSHLKKVDGDLRTILKSGTPFDLPSYIRSIYDRVLSKSNDKALAQTYAQLVPENIQRVISFNPEVRKHVTKTTDMNRFYQVISDFENFQNVEDFLGIGEGIEEDVKDAAASENENSLNPVQEPELTPHELTKSVETTSTWKAKPSSGLTTTGQEALYINGKRTDIADPDKAFHYNIARSIFRALQTSGKEDGQEITYSNRRGFRLTAMSSTQIPFDNLYKGLQEFLDKGGEEARIAHERGVSLVITDVYGFPYYFNDKGEITGSDEGKIAHLAMRVPLLENDRYSLRKQNIQSVEEIAANLGISVEEADNLTQKEFRQLYAIREYILGNPGNNKVIMDITGGSYGTISNDFSRDGKLVSTPLNTLDLKGKSFTIYTSKGTEGETVGANYVKIEGLDKSLQVDRPLVGKDMADKLSSLLLDDLHTIDPISGDRRKLTALERKNIFKAYALSWKGKLDVIPSDTYKELIIRLNTEKLDLSTPQKISEAKKLISDYLSSQFINIDSNSLRTGYTHFDIAGDIIRTENRNYRDYLKSIISVFAQPNEKNQVVQLNAYLSFRVPVEELDKIEPSRKEELVLPDKPEVDATITPETPSDKPVTGKSAKDRFKELRKSNLMTNDATPEQIEAAKRWYESGPLSKHLPFQEMFNIVNSDAFATWTTNGITLYKGANYTDLYHEAWHGFSQMYLTRDQKKNLYNEVRKIKGKLTTLSGMQVPFSLASDFQIEEYLAEDFRKYVLSDGRTLLTNRPTRNNIFQRIWEFIRSLFSRVGTNDVLTQQLSVSGIRELYDKLWFGNINEYRPALSNVQFGVLNKGVERLKEEEGQPLDKEYSRQLVNTMDSLISGLIDASNLETGSYRFTSMLFRNPEGLRIAYDYVLNDPDTGLLKLREKARLKITEAVNDLERQRAQASLNTLDFAIFNFGDVDLAISGRLTKGLIAYHLTKSKYLAPGLRELDLQEEQGTDIEAFDKGLKGHDRNGNELSIKQLASKESLYLIRGLHKVKNNHPVLDRFGVPELTDFKQVFERLTKTLTGSLDMQDMYSRLVKESKSMPEISQLLTKLGAPVNFKDFSSYDMWRKFYRDFSKVEIPLIQVNINKSTRDDKGVDYETGKEVYTLTIGNVAANIRQVPRRFHQEFSTTFDSLYISRDFRGAPSVNVPKVLEDFRNIKGRELEFLRAVGFYLADTPEIREALNEGKINTYFLKRKLQILHSKGVSITNPYKQIADTYVDYGLTGDIGNLNRIYELQVRYSDEYSNDSVTNAENNPQQEHSLNSTLSKMYLRINAAETYQDLVRTPQMKHLDIRTNPHAKSSVILNSVFDMDELSPTFGQRRKQYDSPTAPDVQLKLENLSGVQVINNGEYAEDGVGTSRADEYSKLLMDFHMMLLRGTPELMRHASKSTALSLSVSKINTRDNASGYLYVDTAKFLPQYGDRGFELARDIIFGYMEAELERIKIVKTGTYNNIPGFSQRGKEFTVFDNVFSADTKNKLYGIEVPFSTFLQQTDEASMNLKRALNKELKSYFDALIEDTATLLGKAEYVDPTIYNTIREQIGKSDIKGLLREDMKKASIASFTYNSWVHNFETLSLLYGDLALYNTYLKEEFHKRNASIASTGDIPVTDDEDIKFINSVIGRGYSAQLDIPQKDFNGTFDSAVIHDTKVQSAYLPIYTEAFRSYYSRRGLTGEALDNAVEIASGPYKSMNEGDAQGWMSIDSYRILKVLLGKWTPKHEVLYQRVIKGETVYPQEVSTYLAPMKIQYFGPLVNADFNLTALHKFSIIPLIPSVIKGTSLDELHKDMVKQGIDYALMESGSKITTMTTSGIPDKIYLDNNTRILGDVKFTKNTVHLEYLKDQQDINNEFKGNATFSTQLRKLIEEGLFENGVPVDFMAKSSPDVRMDSWSKLSEEKRVQASRMYDLARKYELNVDKLNNLKKYELIKEAGWKQDASGNVIVGSMKNIMEIIRRELTRQDLADHEIDFVELTQQGNIKYDFSIMPNAEKIERLLTAIVNRRLINQKINGEALVQVSGSFFENRSAFSPERFTKPTQEQLDQYGTNDLPTYSLGTSISRKVNIMMQPDNVSKILAGTKTTTTRSSSQASQIDLKKGESGVAEFGGKKFIVTSRGELTIDEAGGKEVMITSEGVKSEENFKFQQTKDWVNGKGKLYVYDIRPYIPGKTKAMKVKIAMQGGFENLLRLPDVYTKADQENITLIEALNLLLKDENWLNTGDNRKFITMVAVRIPVQGLNSMEFMEVHEFLPKEAGNIIIPPSEIVAKSGSDFDIDKLTVMMPHIKTKKGQVMLYSKYSREEATLIYDTMKKRKLFNLTFQGITQEELRRYFNPKIFESIEKTMSDLIGDHYWQSIEEVLTEEGVLTFDQFFYNLNGVRITENELIDNIRSILELPENFVSLIRPNAVDLVEPLAREMEEINKTKNLGGYNPRMSVRKTKEGIRVETTRVIDGKSKVIVSPTRILEVPYNIHKHASNNIGKQTLGITAVDNSYNTVFNRIGAHMNPFYGIGIDHYEKLSKKNPKSLTNEERRDLKKYRRITMMLNHNKVSYKGYDIISLSHIYDITGTTKISDVISQLMNGLVDIEKDPFILWLQMNQQAAPTILFMVQSGVPLKDIIYFVSQPLVREYIEQQKLARSRFAGPLGTAPEGNVNFFRNKAKQVVIMNPKFKFGVESLRETFGDELYKLQTEATGKVGASAFTLTELEKNLDKQDSDQARAYFLHYLEIEDIAKGIRDLKMNFNFDTRKSSTNFDAFNRVNKIAEVRGNSRIPEYLVDKIMSESIPGSFFIQNFQLSLWKEFFKLRNNPMLNEYLTMRIKMASRVIKIEGEIIPNDIDKTFGDAEKFAEEFRNDLVSYIFQNSLRHFRLRDTRSYKGYNTTTELPVEQVSLAFGAFVKGDTLYVDPKQLKKDWDSKAFNSAKYEALGLAKVPEKVFSNKVTNSQEEFNHYVLEREYLRSITPFRSYTATPDYAERYTELLSSVARKETEEQEVYEKRISRRAYEEMLRDTALDNIMNPTKLFYGNKRSVAYTFLDILKKNPDLRKDYSFVRALAVSDNEKIGMNNLKINDRILDSDTLELYYENMTKLMDPAVIKSLDTEENNRISQFFQRLPLVAFVQSGLSKGEMSLTRMMPQDIFFRLMEEPLKQYVEKMNPNMLDDFYGKFVYENSLKRTRRRFKNYQAPLTLNDYYSLYKSGETKVVTTAPEPELTPSKKDNISTYSSFEPTGNKRGITSYKKLADNNPETLFIYNENTKFTQGQTTDASLRGFNNALGIITKLTGAESRGAIMETAKFTDTTYEKNIAQIEEDIRKINDLYNSGKSITFIKEGYGTYMMESAPQTFNYLSRRLFEEFGYINPGSDKAGSVRELIQQSQPVTDEEVANIIEKCFA